MFSALIFAAGPERVPYVRALAAATGQLQVLREFSSVPSAYELARLINTVDPDIVLMDLRLGQSGFECAARIRECSKRAAIVGLGGESDLGALARQVGFSTVVGPHSSADDLSFAMREALHQHQGGVEQHLFSFLPTKAGSGASTVVLNTGVALAQVHRKRVLVVDADLRSGILANLLGIRPSANIQNLLADASEMDQFRWARSVTSAHGVDFLLSSRALDTAMPEWPAYFQLINFARDRYDAILVDLPELVNPATTELVCRSRMVYPVCTTEIPSLQLTQQRYEELTRCQIPSERIGVLLNRWHKSDPAPAQIGAMLGLPVLRTFPNDYPTVRAAVGDGMPVPMNSRLGQAFADFAGRLLSSVEMQPEPASSLAGRLKGFFASR
jgi:MinD-like ATPase involved in chromosome partitioning or flagellar assembly/CheY-like chemotaxis protein